ncbi:MAG: hypothetical protein ACK5U6_02190 [Pseudanabaena sp.]|nr:hypothetical protein [Pseudanabaena sp. M109S1SP1A06QC]
MQIHEPIDSLDFAVEDINDYITGRFRQIRRICGMWLGDAPNKLSSCLDDKLQEHFVNYEAIELSPDSCCKVFLKGLDFPISFTKQVFINKNQSTGILYLQRFALKIKPRYFSKKLVKQSFQEISCGSFDRKLL